MKKNLKQLLNKSFVIIVVMSMSSCAALKGVYGPKVVAGNENFVTISDPIGIPNGALNMATSHCGDYGKTPAFQAKGGDSLHCTGTTWCTTYECK